MYGSHSAALIIRVSTVLSAGTLSFTCVGNPAPPRPTSPEARTAFTKSALVSMQGGVNSASVNSPSFSMITACETSPEASLTSFTAVTFPETVACTGALTYWSLSPMTCPIFTVSPTLTVGVQGAPICWRIGKVTVSGAGKRFTGISLVCFSCETATPPRTFFFGFIISECIALLLSFRCL